MSEKATKNQVKGLTVKVVNNAFHERDRAVERAGRLQAVISQSITLLESNRVDEALQLLTETRDSPIT